MKTALIEYKGKPAGVLKETDEGYEFLYDKEYLSDADAKPVSLSLPLTEKPYKSPVLFPFFDGGCCPAQYGYQRAGQVFPAASLL